MRLLGDKLRRVYAYYLLEHCHAALAWRLFRISLIPAMNKFVAGPDLGDSSPSTPAQQSHRRQYQYVARGVACTSLQ